MKKSRLLYKIYKIQFQTFGTWFTIWHYCFRIENWRVWHQFWNPRCLHGIQNSFFLWQSGTNDLSLWNQQWTISILRRKDVCKNTFRKNLWNIWRIKSLDFKIYIRLDNKRGVGVSRKSTRGHMAKGRYVASKLPNFVHPTEKKNQLKYLVQLII